MKSISKLVTVHKEAFESALTNKNITKKMSDESSREAKLASLLLYRYTTGESKLYISDKGKIHHVIYLSYREQKQLGVHKYDKGFVIQKFNNQSQDMVLKINKSVSRSAYPNSDDVLGPSEELVSYLLTVALLIPGIIYLHIKCQGDMFIMTCWNARSR